MSHSEIKELKQANQLMEEGKFKESLDLVLKLEKNSNLKEQELLSIKFLKANLLRLLGKFLDAIKCAEELFQESQKQGDLLLSFDALTLHANASVLMGNMGQTEKIIKQADELLKIIRKNSKIDLRERESFLLRNKAAMHYFKGEIHLSLELNEKSFELAKDINHLGYMITCLNNIADKYIRLKEYQKAIMYAKEAIKECNKYNKDYYQLYPVATVIQAYIRIDNIKEAKFYLDQLHKLTNKPDLKGYRFLYLYQKAAILKLSLRARDRIKSEDIFKELAFDKTMTIEIRYDAIISLCELSLIELQMTNDPEIIDEIQPYIKELLNLAESQHLHSILAETYLLQAKLSLLTSELKKAKRFLTQAQKISERVGDKELAEKLLNEQSKLIKQSDVWDKLNELGASMEERIKLAHLNEYIEEIFEKRAMLPAFITEEKVAISKETKICLVCRGDVLRFTYICKCGAIYCDNCARALTNLENVCWVCNNPIDYLKPVKPYSEELEEVNLDDKGKK